MEMKFYFRHVIDFDFIIQNYDNKWCRSLKYLLFHLWLNSLTNPSESEFRILLKYTLLGRQCQFHPASNLLALGMSPLVLQEAAWVDCKCPAGADCGRCIVYLCSLTQHLHLAAHKVVLPCIQACWPPISLRSHSPAFLAPPCPHKAHAKGQQAWPPWSAMSTTATHPKANPQRCNLHTSPCFCQRTTWWTRRGRWKNLSANPNDQDLTTQRQHVPTTTERNERRVI